MVAAHRLASGLGWALSSGGKRRRRRRRGERGDKAETVRSGQLGPAGGGGDRSEEKQESGVACMGREWRTWAGRGRRKMGRAQEK
jgi:hypothetical protein